MKYPEETVEYPERFRGIHRLTQRTDGSPRCVACLCCSTACPAQCIHIEAAEYEPDDPRYGYERFPAVFTIDELRCIFCGYCVEACPCDAIRMDTGMHMPPSTRREHFIFDKDTLLSIPGRDGSYLTPTPATSQATRVIRASIASADTRRGPIARGQPDGDHGRRLPRPGLRRGSADLR